MAGLGMQCVMMLLITDLGNSEGDLESLEKVLFSFEWPWDIQVPVTSAQLDTWVLSLVLNTKIWELHAWEVIFLPAGATVSEKLDI